MNKSFRRRGFFLFEHPFEILIFDHCDSPGRVSYQIQNHFIFWIHNLHWIPCCLRKIICCWACGRCKCHIYDNLTLISIRNKTLIIPISAPSFRLPAASFFFVAIIRRQAGSWKLVTGNFYIINQTHCPNINQRKLRIKHRHNAINNSLFSWYH